MDSNINRTTVRDSSGNYFVVSTILLDAFMNNMDSLISTMSEIVGLEGPSDLSTPGDYETMVFASDADGEVTDWAERDFARYSSEEEALKGHDEMVTKWNTYKEV